MPAAQSKSFLKLTYRFDGDVPTVKMPWVAHRISLLRARRNWAFLVSGLAGLVLAWIAESGAQTLPSGFSEQVALSGLTEPTVVQFASDGRIFVAEKSGLIKVFNSLGDTTPTIFADLRTNVYNYGKSGLLGMALDPNFSTMPYVYVLYTYDGPIGGTAPTWGDSCPPANTDNCVVSARLSRLQANGNVMTGAEQVLIADWYQRYPDQPIGALAFGPDGALYASAGDGAGSTFVDYGQGVNPSPDPPNEGGALRSQDLRTPADPVALSGSIISIHPDTGQPLPQATSMLVGAPTVDANGVKSYAVTSVFQGTQPTIVRVLEPTNPAPGNPRRFLYVLPVQAGVTDLNSTHSDGLEELLLLDIHNRYNLTLIAPSFHIEPWYGDHASNPDRRLESFIIKDLVPFGDSLASPGVIPQRWVLGFSKSGTGALSLILRHPNVFSASAAWDAPAQFADMSTFPGMAENFGTEQNFDRYEIPPLVVDNAEAFSSRNRIWISGDESAWTSHMIQLHDQMVEAGVLHTWTQSGPRVHSWDSGWLEGALASLSANATSEAPIDINAQRIIAYGLRSPSRFAFRPGTNEIWVGDAGLSDREEINRVTNAADGVIENFGSPCYEGTGTTAYAGLSMCNDLYSEPAAVTPPVFAYNHNQQVVVGESCGVGSGSISGIAFYGTGSYPASYQGALFFSDASRNCIWVMPKGAGNLPDPASRSTFMVGAASPVDLKIGPGGDLFFVDLNGGAIRRIVHSGTPVDTTPPVRSNGAPSGTLAAGTTQATLSLATDENATCRYATTAGVAYGSMLNTFTTTGTTAHSTTVSGLSNGGSYSYFVRCQDTPGNANPDDFTISFSVAQPADTTPPVRSNGAPSGALAAGTTQTTLSLATNENATCRYATTANVAYGSMANTFTTTGGAAHSTTVTGLTNGGSYSFYVRCQDTAGNANTNDFTISFTVAQPAGAGLVAAYSFNQGSGTSVADASGNGHSGTISGATWSTLGKFGNALSFDGVNDWVTVNSSSLLNLTTGMTLEAWVFPTITNGVRDIIIKEGSNVDIYNLYARNGGGRPESNVFVGGTNRVAEGAALSANVWTHIAGTYDGSTLRLFINGVQVASTAVTGTIATSTGVLRIGGNSMWGEFFQGRIDEIRIYNRALTQAEIQTDMNTPIGTATNTAPTISAITPQATNEDTATGAIGFTVGDVETAVGSLTVSGSSSNTTLVPNGNIVFGGSGASRTVTITPAANQNGTVNITVTVSDGQLSTPTSFQLTVNAVNDSPTITSIVNQTTTAGVAVGPLNFTVGDVETAAGSLTVSGSSSNTTLVPNGNIVFGGSGANRTVTVTPVAGQTGTATITVTVSDGQLSTPTSFLLTVNAGNTAPTISAITPQATNEDTATGAIGFTVGDVETAAGSLTVSGSSSNTTLVPNGNIVFGGSGASRTVTITPAANQNGTVNITVTVSDGQLSTPTSFQLTVNAVNDSPTITSIANQTTTAGVAVGPLNFTVGDVETAAGSLTVSGSSSNTTLVPNGNIVFGGSGANRTVTVTPAAGQTGTATITVTVSDGQLSTPTSFQLTVNATLAGLVAAYSFNEGSGTSITDASGNGHSGAISGATWSTQGKFGNALSFNGTSNLVTVNSTSLLNLTTGMTLEAWVFPTINNGVRDILIKEGSNVDIYNLYARTGGRSEVNVFVGGANRTAQAATLSANVWTHVAGTYDGATLRLFINGVQAASTAISGSIATSTGPLRIGGNTLWGEFFRGRIDEIRIYNRALTQAEIQADMNTPINP